MGTWGGKCPNTKKNIDHVYFFTQTSDSEKKNINLSQKAQVLKKKKKYIHMGNIIVDITHGLFLHFCIQKFSSVLIHYSNIAETCRLLMLIIIC